MKRFNTYLLEAKDIKAIFQKEVFGSLNNSERDTKLEKEILDILMKFIKFEHGHIITKEEIDKIKILKSAKQYYNILHPKEKVVYRGTKLSLKDIDKNTTFTPSDYKTHHRTFSYFNTIYKPTSSMQSWSTFADIAGEFSLTLKKDIKTEIPVIYKVVVDNDFFLTPELTNKIAMKVKTPADFEILRISKKPIKVQAIITDVNMNKIQNL